MLLAALITTSSASASPFWMQDERAQEPADPSTTTQLLPSSKLRVAFFPNVNFALRSPTTGELRGVAADLAREFASWLGVLAGSRRIPFDHVTARYRSRARRGI